MKSSLMMVLRGDTMRPAIKLSYANSEDLRDSVFGIFNEMFGHVSEWCRVSWEYPQPPLGESKGELPSKVLFISPVARDEMSGELLKLAKRVREHRPDYFEPILNQLWQDQNPPKKLVDELEKDGIKITRDSGNLINISVQSLSRKYVDCSISMIYAIRYMLETITSGDDHHTGEVYQELQKLSRDMPVLCGLQGEGDTKSRNLAIEDKNKG